MQTLKCQLSEEWTKLAYRLLFFLFFDLGNLARFNLQVRKMSRLQTYCSELVNFIVWFSSFYQVQLTDFENAAYVTFIVLLTRVILSFDLNLLIPLSKVRNCLLSATDRGRELVPLFSLFVDRTYTYLIMVNGPYSYSSLRFELACN